MITARPGTPRPVRMFLRNEAGTVTVDWAVMSACVAAMAIATSGALYVGTQTFQEGVESTLKDNVSNVQATSSGTTRGVGQSSTGEEIEFGFAGVSPNVSTSSSRVQCDIFVSNCGVSEDTVTQRFLMNDGTVWSRTTTSFPDGSDDQVVWLDDTGRTTSDVPGLPDDLPNVNLQ